MADELAGFPSRVLGRNPTTRRNGTNDIVPAPPRANSPTTTPRSNRVQSGQIPRTSGPAIGDPDAVNPLGRHFSDSLNG